MNVVRVAELLCESRRASAPVTIETVPAQLDDIESFATHRRQICLAHICSIVCKNSTLIGAVSPVVNAGETPAHQTVVVKLP